MKSEPSDHQDDDEDDGPDELAIVGELGQEQDDLHDKLLEVPVGGECTIFFNSSGGDLYCALSLANLIRYRKLQCTAVVTGECSSAALWPFAACQRRVATPLSVFLFHRAKWESEENIGFREAQQWAAHFEALSQETDKLLAHLLKLPLELVHGWVAEGRYVAANELADQGCVEIWSPESS